jgi:hypothetical protein
MATKQRIGLREIHSERHAAFSAAQDPSSSLRGISGMEAASYPTGPMVASASRARLSLVRSVGYSAGSPLNCVAVNAGSTGAMFTPQRSRALARAAAHSRQMPSIA